MALTEPHSCQAVLLNVSQPAFQGKQNPDLYLFSNFPGVNTHPVAHFKLLLDPTEPRVEQVGTVSSDEQEGGIEPTTEFGCGHRDHYHLLWGGEGGKKWVD